MSIVFLTHVYIYSPAHDTVWQQKTMVMLDGCIWWLYLMVLFDGFIWWLYLPSWLGQEDLSWRHRFLLLSPETSSADPLRFCNHSIIVLLSFWVQTTQDFVWNFITARKRSCGKVMFSQACCLFPRGWGWVPRPGEVSTRSPDMAPATYG